MVRPLLKALLVAAALLVLGSACGRYGYSTPQPTPTPIPLRHFTSGDLVFDYPARWTFSGFGYELFRTTVITFLSTQPLHDPCTTEQHPPGFTIRCGPPLDRLEDGGVLAEWSYGGLLAPPGATAPPGVPLQVGGLTAHVRHLQPPGAACDLLGGTEEVAVAVDRGIPSNYLTFDACGRDTDPGQLESVVRLIMASAHWTGG